MYKCIYVVPEDFSPRVQLLTLLNINIGFAGKRKGGCMDVHVKGKVDFSGHRDVKNAFCDRRCALSDGKDLAFRRGN